MEWRTNYYNLTARYKHVHNYRMEIVNALLTLKLRINNVIFQSVIYYYPLWVFATD